jgi:hypothetical protein
MVTSSFLSTACLKLRKYSHLHHLYPKLNSYIPKLKPINLFFQIGINPGMYAAYKGHHYAGPGNHFCEFSLKLFY